MFFAGSIASKLGLDISDYTRGMLQAESIASLFPDVVRNFLANPLLGVIGVARDAARALVDMFQSATDEADRINDLATALGVSTETISGWGLVASQAGSGLEAMGDGFKFLAKNAAEAAGGSESAVKAFARLGITQDQVKNGQQDLASLMARVADGLAALPEGAARTAVAMELLGRSGTDLIPTLTQGSREILEQIDRFRDYGALVSSTAARSADEWGDAMGEIRIAWRGLRNELAAPIRDALLPRLNELLAWVREHPDAAKAKFKEMGESIARALEAIVKAAELLVRELENVVTLMGAIAGLRAGMQVGSFFGPAGAAIGGAIGFTGGAVGANALYRSVTNNNSFTFNVRGSTNMTPEQFKAAVSESLRETGVVNDVRDVGGGL